MSQSLVLNNAAQIVDTLPIDVPADAALRRYLGKQHRFSAREKSEIAKAVFAYFRWFGWLTATDSTQKQISMAVSLNERFQQNSEAVKPEALAARAVPSWIAAEMQITPEWLRQLQRDPPLWLRARRGKAAELAQKLGECEGGKIAAPEALRYLGHKDLFLTPEFQNGEFEIQDLASQLVSIAAAPSPGETWWDACAGEGGKTLHLADLMGNKGLLWASDRSLRRIQSLKKRAGRAKIFNYRTVAWDGTARLPTKTKFDGVLVDAPCSGVGTWQRNPHSRWTTSPSDVSELSAIQSSLLENVAPSLKIGGKLVYAVCTLTRAETLEVAERFTQMHPEMIPAPVLGRGPQLTLWPQELNANGMFISTWIKKS